MAQRFKVGARVRLRVEKNFTNPTQTLPVGSKGTIILRMSDNVRYRLQFDDREKQSIILDSDLQ